MMLMMMNLDDNNIHDTCNRDDDNVHEVAQDYDDDNIDDAMDCDEVTVKSMRLHEIMMKIMLTLRRFVKRLSWHQR